jgi:Fic family protein
MEPFIPQKLSLIEIEWEQLVPLIGKANYSLARYAGVLYGVPEPGILLSPMTTQEAVMSSRIEGTQATLGEVLRYEAGEEPALESRRNDIQEIINYRVAMREAECHLQTRPFNLNLLLDLHNILLDSVRGRNPGRGTFRRIQNWIGKPGSPIEEADFVPPEPSLVPGALDDWEKYYHRTELDPLVQLAIVHAQFEIIHPFLDGNGRIGRILIPLYLHEKELIDQPIFYMSEYLEEHREEYTARLRVIGQNPNGWNDWIKFFLDALEHQASINTKKASGIIDLYDDYKERVVKITHSQYAIPLLDQIFQKPLFQSRHLQFSDGQTPSRQAISSILRALREDGILKVIRKGRGRRPNLYAFADLINLCEGSEVF